MDKFRLALGFVAAISTVSALECSPRGKGALRKEAPLITAELKPERQKIRFERGPDGHPRWSWPGMGHFDHMLADTRRDATPIRLALGRLEKHLDGQHAVVDRVVLSMTPETSGKTFSLGVELAETDRAYDEARFYSREGWELETGPLADAEAGMPLVFAKGTSRIRFEPTYISPDTALLDSIDDWAYVRALLESDPPVYDDGDVPGDRHSLDVDHEDEIAAARAAGDNEKALSIYRTWRPMGRCSMDDRPAKVAREYAELCYDLGKLGCFLQLQVQIMGDRFYRVAWSTYGEEAASTQAERLYETGLDVDVFLSGLALHFAGVSRRGEIGMRRLARSIKEAGQTDVVAARLAAWAKDPDFDEYNRLGAVQLLSHLDRDGMIDDDELPEIPRMWRALELARAEEAFKNASH